MDSFLEKPQLLILIAKNSLRPDDRHRLGAIKIDKLYDNVIHSAMKSVLCTYLAKERNKALRREFGAQKIDKNLLQKEYLRLKARITEVENTMNETLKSVDKLQANLDETNTSKLALENQTKTARIKWLSFNNKSRSSSLRLKTTKPS